MSALQSCRQGPVCGSRLRHAVGFGCILMLSFTTAHAQSVQDVVLHALEVDPSLAEANANISVAEAQTESARRQHWPRFSVASSQPFNNRQQDLAVEDEVRGVASVNLWSGGGIEATVRQGKSNEDYYRSKDAQAREDLAYSVVQLYLQGLQAEQELSLARINLMRHNSLMHDLAVVANLDQGRRSDLTQAQSRQRQAEARVVTAQTSLDVVRAKLLRYTSGTQVAFQNIAIGGKALEQSEQAVIERQPEYIAQVAEVQSAKHQMEVVKARRWPTISAESGYGSTSDALNRIVVNWDLANPSTFSDVEAARQQVVAAQAHLATVEFDLRERLDTARVSYETAARKVEVTQQQIAAAEQVVAAFEEQFRIARRSMLDLLNAYAELATVESSAANAEEDYQALAFQYLRALGQTEAWARETRSETASVAGGN